MLPSLLIYLVLLFSFSQMSCQQTPKPKRSPLEIGYVQFAAVGPPSTHSHHTVTIHHAPAQHDHNITTHVTHAHAVKHEEHWVPGHVVNHAFIPGHVEHVIVQPEDHELVVTHAVHEIHTLHDVHAVGVVVHPVHNPHDSIYRKAIGGYGVGLTFGGHGAGHGFQVV